MVSSEKIYEKSYYSTTYVTLDVTQLKRNQFEGYFQVRGSNETVETVYCRKGQHQSLTDVDGSLSCNNTAGRLTPLIHNNLKSLNSGTPNSKYQVILESYLKLNT